MGNTAVEDVMNILSEEERQEVLDFALFLAERKRTGTSAPALRFPWAGALEDISPKPTSVDLQHEVVREWGNEWGRR